MNFCKLDIEVFAEAKILNNHYEKDARQDMTFELVLRYFHLSQLIQHLRG